MRAIDIGKEQPARTIEPVITPIPQKEPVKAPPEREPVKTPEKVPA